MAALILVIDDEQSICFAFRRYFEQRGHEVAVAATGQEGLARYRQWHPDVVFLDIRLGDGNGIKFLEELRSRGVDKPVLLMSGLSFEAEDKKAIELTGHPVLRKPIDPEKVFEVVERFIAR